MAKRVRIFGVSLLGLGALAALALTGAGAGLGAAERWLLLGRPLLEFRAPKAGQVVPVGSIEVIIGFPAAERVVVETFRCLLNDQDVTQHLTLGRHGAGGSLQGLLEGENRLRVEIFGRGWWPGRFLEDARELTFRVQPLPTMDRAEVTRVREAA
ncbi:MAG: hypothetical protein O7B23_00720 [Deltaproteobacteria bacterium]|nr:hypothetical protein [Deltaproteobacteria bacterium]